MAAQRIGRLSQHVSTAPAARHGDGSTVASVRAPALLDAPPPPLPARAAARRPSLWPLGCQLTSQPFRALRGWCPSTEWPRARELPPHQGFLPGRVPLDTKLGLTNPDDVNFPLRWGILGAANICADWCRALRNVPGATVVAVAARSGSAAQAFAEEWSIETAYEGYEKLAADPKVDIIYCGSITPLHKEHVLLCIAAGKHVLIEKPISMSAAESEEMYAAAEAKGVMLQEGMWSRYFPATEHCRELLQSGAIGTVKFLQADFGAQLPPPLPSPPSSFVPKRTVLSRDPAKRLHGAR